MIRAATGLSDSLTRPTISAHPSEPWARNPIDALLADSHRARGLKPAAPIARDLWLRRVTST